MRRFAKIVQLFAMALCIWVVISPNLPRAIIGIGLIALTALDNNEASK